MRKNADEEAMLLPMHSFGILLFVLKKPIGISVLGLCAVLFVLSVCVNIFSKKKLSSNTG